MLSFFMKMGKRLYKYHNYKCQKEGIILLAVAKKLILL